MNSKEQKLIIDNILSSGEVFARCNGILLSEYFDPEYRKSVQFIKEYCEKYGTIPSFDLVNAKTDVGFAKRTLTIAEQKSTCDDIEYFCQQQALTQAVLASVEDIESGNFGAMRERINQASTISLQKDMGVSMFDNPEDYLMGLLDNDIIYSTGIKVFDDNLDGGLARKQMTLFSANSGGGKSVMLSNLGINFATLHGMNVLYISLELPEPMIYKRNAFIMTGVNSREWKDKIAAISSRINAIRADGAGSFIIKRLPTGCCTNDVRSFLKQYELEYGFGPDVIVLDYLDLLSPNEGVKGLGISEQDKLKAEQFAQVLHDYNAIGLTASQQNREALKMSSPDQSVIAGGMTKVNTVDNFISLVSDDTLRAKNEMLAKFLKTRSSDGVGKTVMLTFNVSCLRITDKETGGMANIVNNIDKRKKEKLESVTSSKNISGSIDGLPGKTPESTPPAKSDIFLDKIEDGVKIDTNNKKREGVANLSKLTQGKKAKTTVKAVTALDLLEEEERITKYGKLEVEEVPRTNSGKTLSEEDAKFAKEHGLTAETIEHLMSFMD